MANLIEPELTEPLLHSLQSEQFALLSTIDHETGSPMVNAISWVFAKDPNTIFLAINNRSRIVRNIQGNAQVVLNVVALESTYSIIGEAIIRQEYVEGIPLKLALIELNIKEVRDVMFYGAKMTNVPTYDKTYDLEAAKRLDQQVMEALKKA
ncbi:pyridoxamine 5'-phosphate oxidase family protein [Niallia sp. Krafla_26]|uniref:pyridoxamine 5'-phosphate oxidase family protein n=1 Tax=Niallia sp. Krafla_26 TaxID=3064703 RepID=UPI003D164E46